MHPCVREYLSVSGTVWLWIAFLTSAGLFSYRLAFFVRLLQLARQEDRSKQIVTRLKIFITDVFVQPRLRDGMIWPAHLLIFWGFLLFAAAFGFTLFKGLFPFLPYPWPEDVGPANLILEVGAVFVLIALAVAAYRRFVVRPPGVKQTLDAAFILVLIGLLMITFLSAGAFKKLGDEDQAAIWSPVSSTLLFGSAIGNASNYGLRPLRLDVVGTCSPRFGLSRLPAILKTLSSAGCPLQRFPD